MSTKYQSLINKLPTVVNLIPLVYVISHFRFTLKSRLTMILKVVLLLRYISLTKVQQVTEILS